MSDSLPSSSSSPVVTRKETGFMRFSHGGGDNNSDLPPWNRSKYDYHYGSIVASENNNRSSSEDPWSCVVLVATFSVFVSMTLILGLYGTTNVWLGPSLFLIKPTSVFVQNVIGGRIREKISD